MSADTVERSTLDKKTEWGSAVQNIAAFHQHHRRPQEEAHFLPYRQHHHQTAQRAYAHHHHQQQLVGGCWDDATSQPDAGLSSAEAVYESPTSAMEACGVQEEGSFSMAASHSSMPCRDHGDMDASDLHRPTCSPQARFDMLAQNSTSANEKQTSSVTMATQLPQASRDGDQFVSVEKRSLCISPSIKPPASKRITRKKAMSPFTVRPAGTKDRHSKVRTAKGLRDRRVRLSAPTAIQFFDVQDRLGYDQPSKAVDWLIKKARAAIDELAPADSVVVGDDSTDHHLLQQERNSGKDQHDGSIFDVKVKDEEQNMASPPVITGCVRAESRAKARERARERVKEKGAISLITPSSITSATESSAISTCDASAGTMAPNVLEPASAPANVQLLPELLLLSRHIQQQFDDQYPHRASDLSAMVSQPFSALHTPAHLLSLPSHIFPTAVVPSSSSASSFIYTGDVPPARFQFSAPPVYIGNTPISPRGTLQSIFSDSASSSMQAHMHVPSHNMMMVGTLQQADASYGAVFNSVREVEVHDREADLQQQRSAEELQSQDLHRQRSADQLRRSPDLHRHSRIPMRIHGMELDSHAEESRITPSMHADLQ